MALTLANTINDMRLVLNGLTEQIQTVEAVSSIGGLNDVDLTGIQNNDALLYDSSTQTFVTGSVEPARGTNTQIQFNQAGVQTGSAALTFDYTSNTLTTETFVANTVDITQETVGTSNIINLTANTVDITQETVGTSNIINLTANTFLATSITETSAARYKKNIQNVSQDLLSVVELLQPVTYEFLDSEDREYGFIAEDVLPLLPELVKKNEIGEVEGLHYSKMVAVLVKAIQELTQRVRDLENNV